jgi:MarR family transcriptional regulator, lower aerobic nicotinate degradation pathway regulator
VGANEAEASEAATAEASVVAAEAAPSVVAAAAVPDALPDALTASTAFLLRQGARRAALCLADALAPLDLHTRHYGILLALAEDGPSSQSGLGRRLAIDRTTMVTAVDELERLGYLARKPDPKDRRANRVELTGRGRGRLVRATGAIAAAEASLLEGLSPGEVQTLRALLHRVSRRGQSR